MWPIPFWSGLIGAERGWVGRMLSGARYATGCLQSLDRIYGQGTGGNNPINISSLGGQLNEFGLLA